MKYYNSLKKKSLIKGGILLTAAILGGAVLDYGNRTPPRNLEAKSISTYQEELKKTIDNEVKRLVVQRENDTWQKSRISKEATIVRFISIGNEKIKVESSFQEYLEKKKLTHINDSSWENVIRYTQPEDRVVKDVLKQLKIPGKSLEEDAQKILNFTQKGFVYIEEKDSYPKSPLETIVEGGGDCEDLMLLTASLMKGAGMDIVYIALPGKINVPNMRSHLFLGVNGNFKGKFLERDDKKYYFAESTGSSSLLSENKIGRWKIGEIYPSFEKRMDTALIYSLEESKETQKLSFIKKE